MEQWDQDFIDLVVPGYFQFDKDKTGEFRFGAVFGQMDCHTEKHGGEVRLEFSWDGSNELDPASGRGWAEVVGDNMTGHLYFHMGDDSWFKAERD